MAITVGDAVHTKFFTPPEYQVELLNAAIERNIIACINNVATKSFIVLKLIQETFRILSRKDVKKKITLLIAETAQNVTHYTSTLKHLTNYHIDDLSQSSTPFNNENINRSQVVIATSSQSLDIISNGYLSLSDISLLIVDDCHFSTCRTHPLRKVMEYAHGYLHLRIFGMTCPLYINSDLNPGKVEADLNELQRVMCCTVETASDIVSLLRFNNQPAEHLVECNVYEKIKLDYIVLKEISFTVEWIKDHRYDPSEIYDEEFLEDLKNIPDPNIDPLDIIDNFVNVLETMGPWCANKAALASLFNIERLKVKTPYERHFLTLCIVSTLMLKIRIIFDSFFSKYDEKELVYSFMSPKIKRLVNILHRYKPSQRIIELGPKDSSETTINNEAKDKCSEGADNAISGLTMNDTYLHYKNEKLNRWRSRKKGFAKQFFSLKPKPIVNQNESLCAIIFVKNKLIAMVIHYLLADLKKYDDENFWWLSPQFTTEKTADPDKEPKEAEMQHQKLEDVLRKFRTRECNVLIGTPMLEEGIDLPRCNLSVCFNVPKTFRSYVYCRSKANLPNANFFLLFECNEKENFITSLAEYYQIRELLLKRCKNQVESETDEKKADQYNYSVQPFSIPTDNDELTTIRLSDSVGCINRYCAKLPSDTFTRLTPLWNTMTTTLDNEIMHIATLRLPINSPFKKEIMGHPMPTKLLSKRVAALEMCRLLHEFGELDNNMQPIGKENFHLFFAPDEIPPENIDQMNQLEPNEPRPGTNKRKQYYQKRVASCFTNSCPLPKRKLYFYNIEMTLSCPIPEEQNIRGRRIYPPEESPMSFGILLRNPIPKICSFPIFTRCGEVIVSLKLSNDNLMLSEDELKLLENFLLYTFTKVLRLQKYYMKFDTVFGKGLYFVVPTLRVSDTKVIIDWDFVNEINRRKDDNLTFIPDDVREHFVFKRELYSDAVVMPWYRNQNLPQFFYVAEICSNLTPKSKFPGEEYKSFEEYYYRKYQLEIHDLNQPLLDVDHTSARLNFLTPRYVNRKGVALPTCSEATKKARRENLEQKQILVPELCTIHPFPASLWRKAVCLPCILYRINSLLLAEEIRYMVSIEIDLGIRIIPEDFCWDTLNFGWTLADVIKRTAELRESKALKESGKQPLKIMELNNEEEKFDAATDEPTEENKVEDKKLSEEKNKETKNGNDESSVNNENDEPLLEIGTWSNDMASDIHDYSPEFETNFAHTFTTIRYGSPTRWMDQNDEDDDLDSFGDCSEYSNDSTENPSGIRIEFKNDFLAEALDEIEDCTELDNLNQIPAITWNWDNKSDIDDDVEFQMKCFEEAVNKHLNHLLSGNIIVTDDKELRLSPFEKEQLNIECSNSMLLPWKLSASTGYGISAFENFKVDSSGTNEQSINAESDVRNDSMFAANFTASCSIGDFSADPDSNKLDEFSFDYQPELMGHVGPSPSVLLQALTMSNANDGLNLERLETIGDSFLKYAITSYLYCTYDNVHEGKLSHLRSKQVSNLNLYRLGKLKMLGEYMVAGKFEPHDNWLPPCFDVPEQLEKSLIESKVFSCFINKEDLPWIWHVNCSDITLILKSKLVESPEPDKQITIKDISNYLPFHLVTHHAIPDKSVADCVESLIGAYLTTCGIRGALLFISWLGIKVLPVKNNANEISSQKIEYGYLNGPVSPLIRNVPDAEKELDLLLTGYDEFERTIGYHFRDRSYLLQAMTHASYFPNKITDCYQRLEFLGDAILDYLITRHLYEDKRRHSPGALTDLRSALVNNTIFASLAIRFGFHKFFLHLSPGLADVIHRFVRIQEDNGHTIFEEYYLIGEEECEEAEDVEVPKALGDIFESVAGAIYLDSNMSLDEVWKVYYRIMRNEIEQFSTNVPKSPIRELLELEPETVKFGRPEKLADGRRVRVTVEIFGKGTFKGIGRNYRIAKCTAAKCALKQLKKKGLLHKKTISSNTR